MVTPFSTMAARSSRPLWLCIDLSKALDACSQFFSKLRSPAMEPCNIMKLWRALSAFSVAKRTRSLDCVAVQVYIKPCVHHSLAAKQLGQSDEQVMRLPKALSSLMHRRQQEL